MKLASTILVDDDQFVVTTLKQALIALNIEVLGTASTADDAIKLIHTKKVDVAILDLDLGLGPTGIDIAYALRRERPRIGLVFLTSFSDPRIADPYSRELPVGSKFITKSKLSDMGTLVSAIISARKNPLKNLKKTHKGIALTNRQIEVLKLLSTGISTGEMAKKLDVSEKAIEAMITKLYSEL